MGAWWDKLEEPEMLAWMQEQAALPGMTRSGLARAVCERLDLVDARGRRREMACRERLARLGRRQKLTLPPAQAAIPKDAYCTAGGPSSERSGGVELSLGLEFSGTLAELGAIELVLVSGATADSRLWNALMQAHHPLGAGPLCGAQLRYLVRCARGVVGALAFSAAARRLACREQFLGWDEATRRTQLQHVVGNSRFLICPQVCVPHLASHVLAGVRARLAQDWQQAYGYRPWAIETFVGAPWRGTCYLAAGWMEIGVSAGRGRQDRGRSVSAGAKRVFLCLLEPARFPHARREPVPVVPPPEQDWAAAEFGAAALEARLVRRTCTVARDFFARPTANLPQACASAARLKGALRLFAHPDVTMESLLAPHHQQTHARMREHPVVLAVCDSCALNYRAHPATAGLGPIGSRTDGPIGLWLHETMAFTPQGVPLGLLDVQHYARDPQRFGKRTERRALPIEQKESFKWIKSFAAAQDARAACPDTQVVLIGDRESDVYELLLEAADAQAQILIRAEQNRRTTGAHKSLWASVEASEVLGYSDVTVGRRMTRNGMQPPRQATLAIRMAEIELRSPKSRTLPKVTVCAILAREIDAPPAIGEPLEWMLLTTVPTAGIEQARERLDWYAQRWGIEIYHRTLKSGCRLEQRQLGSADRLEACIAIDMVVAWRVMYLVHLGRSLPHAPATLYFEDVQWKALWCFTERTSRPPALPPTLDAAMRRVAKLGGFLGRKCDGHPGAQTLWLGLQRLDDITLMYRAITEEFPQGP